MDYLSPLGNNMATSGRSKDHELTLPSAAQVVRVILLELNADLLASVWLARTPSTSAR